VVHVLTPITDNRVVGAGRVSVIGILFAVRAVTDGAGQMEIRNTLIPNQCHISVNVRVRNSVGVERGPVHTVVFDERAVLALKDQSSTGPDVERAQYMNRPRFEVGVTRELLSCHKLSRADVFRDGGCPCTVAPAQVIQFLTMLSDQQIGERKWGVLANQCSAAEELAANDIEWRV